MRVDRAAGVTDTGRRRLRNEDAFICEPPLFAVADGMGGARAGEVAAGLAATVLEEQADAHDEAGLVARIEEANRRIWERSLADPSTAGMGAVVTAAIVDTDAGTVTLGHVGDSRGYRIRDGAIEQLTTDHSLVAELVESGVLTPEEAEIHPQRSAITRALGTEPVVTVDTIVVDAVAGDLFLLCSDGLSNMLEDEAIAEIVASADGDPEQAAELLVRAANAQGGEDNVTVVIFELGAGEAEDAGPEPTTESDGKTDLPVTDDSLSGEPPAVPTGDAEASPRRHGAGPGGRIAAIVLVVGLVALALFLVYQTVGQ